jgi:hypothetical protein
MLNRNACICLYAAGVAAFAWFCPLLSPDVVRMSWQFLKFTTDQPLGDPAFLSSIDSPPSLSFLRWATSQLYTRANATSSVWQLLV